MAEDLGSMLGISGNTVSGAVSGLTEAIIWLMIILAICGLMWLFFWWTSFKFRIRIREIINGRQIVSEDRAKRKKDRDGIYWWKLRKLRVKIPEPPSECIDINRKGKKVLELFRADDGSFIPISVNFDYTAWKKEQLDSKKVEAFKPFSSNQRAMYVHELRESETYKKKKLGEILMGLAPYIAIVLILVIFMLFFGEVVKPIGSLSEGLTEASKELKSASDTLSETCLGKIKLQIQEINTTTGNTNPAPN